MAFLIYITFEQKRVASIVCCQTLTFLNCLLILITDIVLESRLYFACAIVICWEREAWRLTADHFFLLIIRTFLRWSSRTIWNICQTILFKIYWFFNLFEFFLYCRGYSQIITILIINQFKIRPYHTRAIFITWTCIYLWYRQKSESK